MNRREVLIAGAVGVVILAVAIAAAIARSSGSASTRHKLQTQWFNDSLSQMTVEYTTEAGEPSSVPLIMADGQSILPQSTEPDVGNYSPVCVVTFPPSAQVPTVTTYRVYDYSYGRTISTAAQDECNELGRDQGAHETGPAAGG